MPINVFPHFDKFEQGTGSRNCGRGKQATKMAPDANCGPRYRQTGSDIMQRKYPVVAMVILLSLITIG
jgi:hypothetical protein